jgi:hypothetical protein
MKTSKLTRAALDWAVAKCEGMIRPDGGTYAGYHGNIHRFKPSTDWTQGGQIIERENISITSTDFPWWECEEGWYAHIGDCYAHGLTPLIAAMRCYVASKLGDEVEIPKELL